MKYVILMTATIDPGPFAKKVARNDPAVRLKDYELALLRNTQLQDDRIAGIVFCENSASDISTLSVIAQESRIPVEILSFDGNHMIENMSYGYSELGTIDHALSNSLLLQNAPYFIKMTGRLTFPHLAALLDTLPDDFDAVLDYVTVRERNQRFQFRTRCQLLLFRTEFYQKVLMGKRDMMPKVTKIPEEFIPYIIEQNAEDFSIIRRFPVECSPSGVCGYNGRSYSDIQQRTKHLLRNVVRRLLPSLWI